MVRELGMGERPVNQGPNNMAYLVNLLASYAGGYRGVRSLRVRFLANVFAGDRLVAGGEVTHIGRTPRRRRRTNPYCPTCGCDATATRTTR